MINAIQKLQKTSQPTLLITDIDGTIFTAGFEIVSAPFFNVQTAQILRKNFIPLVLITGRSHWSNVSDFEMYIHGLPRPDVVITSAGTSLYERTTKGILQQDTVWESVLAETEVKICSRQQITSEKWNGNSILSYVEHYLNQTFPKYKIRLSNPFFIRITLIHISMEQLTSLVKQFKLMFPSGVEVLVTEKLLFKNSLTLFSGDVILVPKTAGKDKVVHYLLTKYARILKQQIHGICFGDASIDVPMLTMNHQHDDYLLSQYAVHLTPLAKDTLTQMKSTHSRVTMLTLHGPQAILSVLRATENNKQYYLLSQNSIARSILRFLEKPLNQLFDKAYSPNQISFIGLKQTLKAIRSPDSSKKSTKQITRSFYFISGMITDLFDGIRARQTNTFAPDGQLIDVFCDRAKEFYQLYARAKKNFSSNNVSAGYNSLLTAISCILPSLSRAQCEFYNIAVFERDQKGGSMFDRSRRLTLSFFFENFGLLPKANILDKKIYEANLATFQNRLNNLPLQENMVLNIKIETTLQQKALERFLLLLHIFQEENTIIENLLKDYPELLKKFKNYMQKNFSHYLQEDIFKIRKRYQLTKSNLSLYTYINEFS